MAQFYVLNTTTLGLLKYYAGDLADDALDPTTALAAAGAILWPATDAVVAAGAARAQSRRLSRGMNEQELDSIMLASASASITAGIASASADYRARGVCITNMSITAFVGVAGGTAQNGVTYVAGDYVLLAAQTTAAECGLYQVGTVAGGVAPLTRIPALQTGTTYVNGATVEVSNECTLLGGSSWKAMCTGTVVVGTGDPLFYPRVCKGVLTLAAGTYTLGAAEGLFLFSVAKSAADFSMNTPGGTVTSTVGGYGSNAAGRVAGKSGAASAIVIARVAAGTIDVANTSTVDWNFTNW